MSIDFLRASQFQLPQERIAVVPASNRVDARMLVFNRDRRSLEHQHVRDLPRFFRSNDILVLNCASVDPARVLWKDHCGRQQELLFLRPMSEDHQGSRWEALVSGRRLEMKKKFGLPNGMTFYLEERKDRGLATVSLSRSIKSVTEWLSGVGIPPLPPYVRQERLRRNLPTDLPLDQERYQTVFAQKSGAIAAPTAGLHFSPGLLHEIEDLGVDIAHVYLAVGWGTFQPLTEKHWKAGKLHPEYAEMTSETASKILKALAENRRVIAVGTTSVRVLEWWSQLGQPQEGCAGWCDLFIRPPFSFQTVHGLLTNFHLPQSSLLALVAAFLDPEGEEKMLSLYKEAIAKKYRFFSYGDSMLVL